jgi:GxxExxY protein
LALEYEELAWRIIACAVEVHRKLGPGFPESVYENALVIELNNNGLDVKKQYEINIDYKGKKTGKHRVDLLINDKIVVELKAVKSIENIHFSIVRSYLKALNLMHGLILNFNSKKLEIKRVILNY